MDPLIKNFYLVCVVPSRLFILILLINVELLKKYLYLLSDIFAMTQKRIDFPPFLFAFPTKQSKEWTVLLCRPGGK